MREQFVKLHNQLEYNACLTFNNISLLFISLTFWTVKQVWMKLDTKFLSTCVTPSIFIQGQSYSFLIVLWIISYFLIYQLVIIKITIIHLQFNRTEIAMIFVQKENEHPKYQKYSIKILYLHKIWLTWI